MEIKTCEEYVLAQLQEAHEEIENLKAKLRLYEGVNNNGASTTTVSSEIQTEDI